MIDPVNLAQALIRRPSVTPADAGAMEVLQHALEGIGFHCRRMKFGEIENLYARRGTAAPNLCFAGHTDVVPPGPEGEWTAGPFEGAILDGVLHGRGAADMKSAVAAFVAAASQTGDIPGSLSLLITGDEEGEAVDGTRKVVDALMAEGERIDHCIVGEPTSSERLGDMIKVGRRGSISAAITVEGVQGHVAYPHRAANPIPVLIDLLQRLQSRRLDDGYPEFQPSNLEVTDIAVGNPAGNVIPGKAHARLNIRFNPAHTGATLAGWIEEECGEAEECFAGKVHVRTTISGEAFHTPPSPFVQTAAAVVREVTGVEPDLSTTGGTSDARFIRALCPVIEFGLVGQTMHKIDEQAPVAEIRMLTEVYRRLIERYFEPALTLDASASASLSPADKPL